MRDTRLPIERLVDEACGVPSGDFASLMVMMRCPKCGTEKQAKRESHDLPGTAVVVYPCLDCHEGDYHEVFYLDANGTQIMEVSDAD